MMSKEVALLKAYLEAQGEQVQVERSSKTEFAEIKWKKNGEQHYVYSTDVVYHKGRLAWFQSTEQDVYHLCILENDKLWTWEPELYNPFFGCICIALRWMDNYLALVYQDKHDVYITVIQQRQVQYYQFYGNKFKLTNTHFAYQTYQQERRDLVGLLELPSLKHLGERELRAAKLMGLEPQEFR